MFGIDPVDWYLICLASATVCAVMCGLLNDATDLYIIFVLAFLGPIIAAFTIVACALYFFAWLERRPGDPPL